MALSTLGESVTPYVADLQGLVSLCRFRALQDEMLCDQLIVHTNCEKITERLLLEHRCHPLAVTVTCAVQRCGLPQGFCPPAPGRSDGDTFIQLCRFTPGSP